MNDLNARMRKLKSAAIDGTLSKQLGFGTYILTGWLGDTDKKQPRIRMETLEIKAKGLPAAKAQYLRQFKNQLPDEAFNETMGLVVVRVASNEAPQTFPADTTPVTGVVKFFKEIEGTGYITVDGKDFFVHHSEILCDEEVFPTLANGQTVSFIPGVRNERPVACSVTSVEE